MLLPLRLRRSRRQAGHVALHQTPTLRLIQRGAQNLMDLTDRRWRQVSLPQLTVEPIDIERGQLRQPDRTEYRHDLTIDVLARRSDLPGILWCAPRESNPEPAD